MELGAGCQYLILDTWLWSLHYYIVKPLFISDDESEDLPSTQTSNVSFVSTKDHILVARIAVIIHLLQHTIAKIRSDDVHPRTRSQRYIQSDHTEVNVSCVQGAKKLINNCRKQGMMIMELMH
jgi:hypothetical protein